MAMATHSPEVKSLQARLQAADKEIQKAKAGHAPTLDAVAQWSDSGSENVTRLNSSFENKTLGFQLTIPLYQGGYVSSLERQADALGVINLTAIDECRELEKRHDFLRTQADDLTHALNQLEKAIIKINRTTKKRFQETFEGINERFQQVFPRLFRGGKAWLALTDPNDMLSTGVEIYAQPPGKKLVSVNLMSGGEQALTAVSLLFAIFLLKPSPFCLLDEVDAPLDEANVGRFNDMVKDVSALSQFIVITHNKKTMEVADQLYGITMEEPGISKTVNVRIQ
jgi:chromosome segregation protein